MPPATSVSFARRTARRTTASVTAPRTSGINPDTIASDTAAPTIATTSETISSTATTTTRKTASATTRKTAGAIPPAIAPTTPSAAIPFKTTSTSTASTATTGKTASTTTRRTAGTIPPIITVASTSSPAVATPSTRETSSGPALASTLAAITTTTVRTSSATAGRSIPTVARQATECATAATPTPTIASDATTTPVASDTTTRSSITSATALGTTTTVDLTNLPAGADAATTATTPRTGSSSTSTTTSKGTAAPRPAVRSRGLNGLARRRKGRRDNEVDPPEPQQQRLPMALAPPEVKAFVNEFSTDLVSNVDPQETVETGMTHVRCKLCDRDSQQQDSGSITHSHAGLSADGTIRLIHYSRHFAVYHIDVMNDPDFKKSAPDPGLTVDEDGFWRCGHHVCGGSVRPENSSTNIRVLPSRTVQLHVESAFHRRMVGRFLKTPEELADKHAKLSEAYRAAQPSMFASIIGAFDKRHQVWSDAGVKGPSPKASAHKLFHLTHLPSKLPPNPFYRPDASIPSAQELMIQGDAVVRVLGIGILGFDEKEWSKLVRVGRHRGASLIAMTLGHRFPAYRDLKEVYDAWKEVTDCLLIRSNQSFLQPAEADDESETESDDEAPTAENEDVDVQIVNHGLAGEGDEDQDYEVRNEKDMADFDRVADELLSRLLTHGVMTVKEFSDRMRRTIYLPPVGGGQHQSQFDGWSVARDVKGVDSFVILVRLLLCLRSGVATLADLTSSNAQSYKTIRSWKWADRQLARFLSEEMHVWSGSTQDGHFGVLLPRIEGSHWMRAVEAYRDRHLPEKTIDQAIDFLSETTSRKLNYEEQVTFMTGLDLASCGRSWACPFALTEFALWAERGRRVR